MTKLDELIKELCPEGVAYKTLGEIATDVFRGSGITREQGGNKTVLQLKQERELEMERKLEIEHQYSRGRWQ